MIAASTTRARKHDDKRADCASTPEELSTRRGRIPAARDAAPPAKIRGILTAVPLELLEVAAPVAAGAGTASGAPLEEQAGG